MNQKNESLYKTWSNRIPERVHTKGYKGPAGKIIFLIKYVIIKNVDVLARHCPFPVIRERLYQCMGVKIGKGTFIDRDVYFDTSWPELIIIGKGVSIAQCSILLCHEYDTAQYKKGDLIHHLPHKILPIKIEDNVMIGSRVTILQGVTIGEGSIIGTGSVVNRSVPPWSIAVGIPARVIRTISDI